MAGGFWACSHSSQMVFGSIFCENLEHPNVQYQVLGDNATPKTRGWPHNSVYISGHGSVWWGMASVWQCMVEHGKCMAVYVGAWQVHGSVRMMSGQMEGGLIMHHDLPTLGDFARLRWTVNKYMQWYLLHQLTVCRSKTTARKLAAECRSKVTCDLNVT